MDTWRTKIALQRKLIRYSLKFNEIINFVIVLFENFIVKNYISSQVVLSIDLCKVYFSYLVFLARAWQLPILELYSFPSSQNQVIFSNDKKTLYNSMLLTRF
jgi:hypothetical protein